MPIPLLTAIRYDATFEHGRSRPLLIVAEDLNGARHDVVLKMREPQRLDSLALIAELVASLLARDVGLNSPDPFLVEVTPEFARSVPNQDARKRLEAAPGLHFASRLISGQFHLPIGHTALPHGAIDHAAAVLTFDLLTGNDDRHREKANCLIRATDIVIIDHERAFPVLRQEHAAHAWEAGGLARIRQHVFFESLRGQLPDLSALNDRLKLLTPEQISTYIAHVPAMWDEPAALRRLESFLLDLRRHYFKAMLSIQEELR
jgi:hypothetical protein